MKMQFFTTRQKQTGYKLEYETAEFRFPIFTDAFQRRCTPGSRAARDRSRPSSTLVPNRAGKRSRAPIWERGLRNVRVLQFHVGSWDRWSTVLGYNKGEMRVRTLFCLEAQLDMPACYSPCDVMRPRQIRITW